jgi:hypothetical protein
VWGYRSGFFGRTNFIFIGRKNIAIIFFLFQTGKILFPIKYNLKFFYAHYVIFFKLNKIKKSLI